MIFYIAISWTFQKKEQLINPMHIIQTAWIQILKLLGDPKKLLNFSVDHFSLL